MSTAQCGINKKPLKTKKEWLPLLAFDLRSLALFRIGLGLLIIADLLNRAEYLRAHYTDFGVLPRSVFFEKFAHAFHFSFHFASGTMTLQVIFFIVSALCAIFLIAGYKTRLFTVLSWMLLCSLQVRNTMVLQGGDVLFRLLLFWAIFMPIGAKYSLDFAMNPHKEKIPQSHGSFGTVAFAFQLVFLYVFSCLLKLDGETWLPDGTASYFALNLDHFLTPIGQIVQQYFGLLKAMTYGVFFWEFFGPFLLICPFYSHIVRPIGALGFIAMHHGFGLSMELGLFHWIDTVSMLPFFSPWFLDKIIALFKPYKYQALVMYYDADCGFCKKLLLLIQTFFLPKQIKMTPAQSSADIEAEMLKQNSWVVIDEKGNRFFKFEALCLVFENSPFLKYFVPLMRVKFISKIGLSSYEWIADHRQLMGKFTSWLQYKSYSVKGSLTGDFLAIFFLVFIFFWNLGTYRPSRFGVPKDISFLGVLLQVEQKWDMFAPRPMTDDGWFVIPGELRNGKKVDLFRDKKSVSWEKPELVSSTYPNQRWRKYMMNLWSANNSKHRLYYGKWLCRSNNENVPHNEQLVSFKMYYMKEETLLNYKTKPVEKVLLWTHNCFK